MSFSKLSMAYEPKREETRESEFTTGEDNYVPDKLSVTSSFNVFH